MTWRQLAALVDGEGGHDLEITGSTGGNASSFYFETSSSEEQLHGQLSSGAPAGAAILSVRLQWGRDPVTDLLVSCSAVTMKSKTLLVALLVIAICVIIVPTVFASEFCKMKDSPLVRTSTGTNCEASSATGDAINLDITDVTFSATTATTAVTPSTTDAEKNSISDTTEDDSSSSDTYEKEKKFVIREKNLCHFLHLPCIKLP
ncbi:hypothetical protein LSAT2_014919 [Lamellibrachia satsuma]|nr:hypothetical protein LSAT2_014919 [Lamellibrachia satsuma]